jgi:inorganic pyrophosphatase
MLLIWFCTVTKRVRQVKVLGAFAMIDDGELDWKVLAIRADDPLASTCSDVGDVDRRVISGMQHVLAALASF